MLKYVNTDVVFQEIPDETTLAINISGCPCRCPGCHSSYLWNDIGTELTPASLEKLIEDDGGRGITCVCFMGGDSEPGTVNKLASLVKEKHPYLKIGWYSGRTVMSSAIDRRNFDYIKIGPYIRHLGSLSSPRTNQRMYRKLPDGSFEDITGRFTKNGGQQTSRKD